MHAVTRAALCVIILFAACDSPTANEGGVAFDMIQSASQTLPIELGETQTGCVDSLYAARVVLEADNDAYSFSGVVRNCGGGRTQLNRTRVGTYQQINNELSFTWEIEDDPIIAYVTEQAVLDANMLTFRMRAFSAEDPDGTTFYDYAVYRRR